MNRGTLTAVHRGDYYSQLPAESASGSVHHQAHASGFVVGSDSNNGGVLIPLFSDADGKVSVDSLCRQLGYRLVAVRKGRAR